MNVLHYKQILTNINKSLCWAPETNLMLFVQCTSIKKKNSTVRLWVLLQSLVKVFVCGSRQLTGAVQITVHLWYVAERPLPYSSGVFSRGLPFLYCLWMEGWITAWFLASMLFCNSAEWEEKEEGRGRRRRILSGTLHCRSPCSVLLAREKGFLEVIAACLTVTSVLLCTRDWPQGRAARENRGHKKQHGIPTSPAPSVSSSQSSLCLVLWPER